MIVQIYYSHNNNKFVKLYLLTYIVLAFVSLQRTFLNSYLCINFLKLYLKCVRSLALFILRFVFETELFRESHEKISLLPNQGLPNIL